MMDLEWPLKKVSVPISLAMGILWWLSHCTIVPAGFLSFLIGWWCKMALAPYHQRLWLLKSPAMQAFTHGWTVWIMSARYFGIAGEYML